MTDVQDAEIVESTELAVVPSQPISLFGTTEPAEVIAKASAHATALADVIKAKGLFTRISNRDHVRVEGWQLLGSMVGVYAVVTSTNPIENGWEARCEARTLAGQVVGAADAQCTRDEKTWKNRDDYALRSMAQTRAISKALKSPLGFIVSLAGYSATPAEEMTFEHSEPEPTFPEWLTNLTWKHDEKAIIDAVEAVRKASGRGSPIKTLRACASAPSDFIPLIEKKLGESSKEEPKAGAPSEATASPQPSEGESGARPSAATPPSAEVDWSAKAARKAEEAKGTLV